MLYSSPVDTLFSDYDVSRAPAPLRMTDNEVLSSHSGEHRMHVPNSSSSPNHANSSRSLSLGESRIEEDEASNEAKGHSADDEGRKRLKVQLLKTFETEAFDKCQLSDPESWPFIDSWLSVEDYLGT